MSRWLEDFLLITLDRVDSTNDEAKRIIASGNIDSNLVIWAHEQTNGRGQKGRRWESMEANLFVSVTLPLTCSMDRLPELSIVTSLGVNRAIQGALGAGQEEVQHKWPNDVLIGGKKVAGILLAALPQRDKVVVGIGVNVANCPRGLDRPVCCLADFGVEIDAGGMLGRLMEEFATLYAGWHDALSLGELGRAWMQTAWGIGQVIELDTGNSVLSGRFVGIDEHGSLLLETGPGRIHRIRSAEFV